MDCVILAGGKGTRLRSAVSDVPKPMADIGGRPFLEILMNHLADCGVSRFLLCVSYLREIIIRYFGSSYHGIPVSYVIEESPLGTGGAIKNAFLSTNINSALVVNGDTFLRTDYGKFWVVSEFDPLAIMLAKVDDTSRYGYVETIENYISAFREKNSFKSPGLINAGVYKITRNILSYMPNGCFSFENDFLTKKVQTLNPKFYLSTSYFIDIGIPESYIEAKTTLTQNLDTGEKDAR